MGAGGSLEPPEPLYFKGARRRAGRLTWAQGVHLNPLSLLALFSLSLSRALDRMTPVEENRKLLFAAASRPSAAWRSKTNGRRSAQVRLPPTPMAWPALCCAVQGGAVLCGAGRGGARGGVFSRGSVGWCGAVLYCPAPLCRAVLCGGTVLWAQCCAVSPCRAAWRHHLGGEGPDVPGQGGRPA